MGYCHTHCRQEPSLGPSFLPGIYSGMALGSQTVELQSTRERSGLNRRTNNETFSVKSAFITIIPAEEAQQGKPLHSPSAPGTVHSLQGRRECSQL